MGLLFCTAVPLHTPWGANRCVIGILQLTAFVLPTVRALVSEMICHMWHDTL